MPLTPLSNDSKDIQDFDNDVRLSNMSPPVPLEPWSLLYTTHRMDILLCVYRASVRVDHIIEKWFQD